MNVSLELAHTTLHLKWPDNFVADRKVYPVSHPLNYVINYKNSTCDYLSKISSVLIGLPRDLNVVEYCGGIGLVSLAVKDALRPASWRCIDLDPTCGPMFMNPDATFEVGNMFDANPIGADMVVLDAPTNTLPKMWREPKRAAMLRRIADAKPRFWEITDVAHYWIHLANHWPIYQERFGCKPTRDNYPMLFDRFMRETYGYTVIKHAVGGGAAYFLMVPNESVPVAA